MSYSPALGPCAPAPVCGPSPVPRRQSRSLLQQALTMVDEAVLQPWRVRVARDRLLSEMSRMDHRELKDMNLSEDEVPYFVASWTPRH